MLSRGKLMVQKVIQLHDEHRLKETIGLTPLSEVKATCSQGTQEIQNNNVSLVNVDDIQSVVCPSGGNSVDNSSYYSQHDEHIEREAKSSCVIPYQYDKSDSDYEIYETSGSEYQPSESDDDNDEQSEPDVNVREPTLNEVRNTNQNLTCKGTKRIKTFPIKQKVSKKRIKDPDSWKRKAAAIRREKRKSYISYKGNVVPEKSFCSGSLCSETCRLKCSTKFDLDTRALIFNDFYKLDVNTKNALLFRSIIPLTVRRERKNATKHKSCSYKYTVILDNQQVFVCKRAFCSIYQISRRKVDIIREKLKTGKSVPSKDRRSIHTNRPHKMSEAVEQAIRTHIDSFPTEESHYSRNSNPHKRYLAPNLNMSLIDQCKEHNMPNNFLVNKSSYANIFSTKFNLSFSHPKSDTCSKCDAGDSNAEHKENVYLGFQLMSKDRENALTDEKVCYITVDLQQTMPLPKITTSKALQTWTEDVAGRGSTEVVSCLWNFVQTYETVKTKEQLTVWSDSCAGQNKNFLMICFYQLLILKGSFKVIDHKFPEVGHTFLDSDRDFGRIEKVLRKHSTIFTPDQYRQIIKSACTKKSTVNDMEQYFRDSDGLPNKMGLVNKKKNLLNENGPFRDGIKWIRVEEFGSYLYKESYDEYIPFNKVSLFKNSPAENYVPPTDIEFTRIRHKTGNISEKKIANIREQLHLIGNSAISN